MLWDLHTESVLEASPLEPAVAHEAGDAARGRVAGGAWAVERAQGFGHEPGYVPRWPVPEDTTIDAVRALIAEPAVKLMLRHNVLSADVLLERARATCGHLAEFSHSSTSDTCSRSTPPA